MLHQFPCITWGMHHKAHDIHRAACTAWRSLQDTEAHDLHDLLRIPRWDHVPTIIVKAALSRAAILHARMIATSSCRAFVTMAESNCNHPMDSASLLD